jgi:uncharacterized protein
MSTSETMPARAISARSLGEAHLGHRHQSGGGVWRLWLYLGLAVLGLGLTACGRFPDWPSSGKNIGHLCQRPSNIQTDSFNDQEQELRNLRKLAFSNDFFAQLSLASRYAALKSTDENIKDPIESSVWLAMALSNPQGYEPMSRRLEGNKSRVSEFDKCRAFERNRAYKSLDNQLSLMDNDERDKVRDRVTYLLSTLNAEGFRTLARLYDSQYGPMGEPANDPQAVHAMMKNDNDKRGHVRNLFPRSDVDAYLYYAKAASTGDIASYALLREFEGSANGRKRYASLVDDKVKRWVAPYEFYPSEASPAGALPHSDEARRTYSSEIAVVRMAELPFSHVARAFNYLGIAPTTPAKPEDISRQSLTSLRAMLGVSNGNMKLIAIDRLRAMQMAAVNGDPRSQLVLAVMYSEGVGVPIDYARAFYWYKQAAKQGSGEAKYAMATYFSLGMAGISDQNRAQAVVLQLSSALDGFTPSIDRLKGILSQVGRSTNSSDMSTRYDPNVTAYDNNGTAPENTAAPENTVTVEEDKP